MTEEGEETRSGGTRRRVSSAPSDEREADLGIRRNTIRGWEGTYQLVEEILRET